VRVRECNMELLGLLLSLVYLPFLCYHPCISDFYDSDPFISNDSRLKVNGSLRQNYK
jgi:hypothetical protein